MDSKEEARDIIKGNLLLQEVLKIMNNIPLIQENEEEEYDYMKLYENVSLMKKTKSIEYKPESAQFYYQLMDLGYSNFGEEFFEKMLQANPQYLITAMILFIEQLAQSTQYIQKLETKLNDTEKDKNEN